jgi:hypothetical protein
VHGALLLPPATKGGLTLSTAYHDAIVAWDNATSENSPSTHLNEQGGDEVSFTPSPLGNPMSIGELHYYYYYYYCPPSAT